MRCACVAPFFFAAAVAFRAKRASSGQESIISTFGSGSDVCEPEKGYIWDGPKPEDSKLVQRLEDKQKSALKIAVWLDETHCIFGMKDGKVCLAKWIELGQRLSKMRSCVKVPRDNSTLLSKAVWGSGSSNLKDFFHKVNVHMTSALNHNSQMKSYLLEPNNCKLNLDKISESVVKRVKEEAKTAVVDKVVEDVMGSDCDVSKSPTLALVMKSLKKTIKDTIEDVRNGDMDAPISRMKEHDKEAMDTPIPLTGHQLAEEDIGDVPDGEETVGTQMTEALMEIASDVQKADTTKILIWILLFLLFGPITVIIWIVLLLVDRKDLLGI